MRKPTVYEKLKNKVKDHDVSQSTALYSIKRFLCNVITAAICY